MKSRVNQAQAVSCSYVAFFHPFVEYVSPVKHTETSSILLHFISSKKGLENTGVNPKISLEKTQRDPMS